MKIKHITAAMLLSAASSQAASITLQNAGFQDSAHDSNPTNWTTVEGDAGHIYVYATGGGIPTETNVLAFHGRPDNYIQQSFSTSEAVAGQSSSYEVTFDSGWRNNTAASNNLSLKMSLWNMTDDVEINSATYTFLANSPSNASDTYRVINTGNTLSIADTSGAGDAGDTIGLRITSVSTQDFYDPTGWIDNVSVESVPEPSSTALLGLGGLALILRRRK